MGDLLRACGQNPTLAEIRDLEKGVGGDCELFFPFLGRQEFKGKFVWLVRVSGRADVFVGNVVDFDSFQKVLNRPGGFRDPGEPEEYCRGFQVFDKDMTGFIGVGQLRYSGSIDLKEKDASVGALTGGCSFDESGGENE